jgi:hypothetical protein
VKGKIWKGALRHPTHFTALAIHLACSVARLLLLRLCCRLRGKRLALIGLVETAEDIAQRAPVARRLRRRLPKAVIVWVTRRPFRGLVVPDPNVDRVLTVICLTEWMAIRRLAVFDLALDLHAFWKECQVCRIPLSQPLTHLTRKRDNDPDNSLFPNDRARSEAFAKSQEDLDEASRGIVTAEVDDFLLPHGFVCVKPLPDRAGLEPDPGAWTELCFQIHGTLHLPVVEIGERSVLDFYESAEYRNLCAKCTNLQAAEVIRRAGVLITCDSVLARLAACTGTEHVVLKRGSPERGMGGRGREERPGTAGNPGPREESRLTETLSAVRGALAMSRARSHLEDAEKRPGEPQTKLIAFYLPQFHPIPENDLWWNPGFTEWSNVAGTGPLFDGHEQPHLPADLGFYDLRIPEMRERQAALAARYGIHGFCYYHYWFHGRALLEGPLNDSLASGRPDFPFCLCWANESWSREWDGKGRRVLCEQTYSEQDDREHIDLLLRIFSHPRYIRVDDKPLFLFYRASRLPDVEKTAELWRREAGRAGFPGLYLCCVQSFEEEFFDPGPRGLDAAVEFPPNCIDCGPRSQRGPIWGLLRLLGLANKAFKRNSVREYAALVEAMLARDPSPYRRIPCIVPGFDNTSRRRQGGALIFRNAHPRIYEQWLEQVLEREMKRKEKAPLVFINAWNEWAEGNHLEPCQRFGHARLACTRRALEGHGPILTP